MTTPSVLAGQSMPAAPIPLSDSLPAAGVE